MPNLTDYYQYYKSAFLGSATVSGAAATTLTLSGLNLSAYKAFHVVAALKNSTGSACNLSMYYNSDTIATNYHRQYLSASSTSVTGSRANDAIIGVLSASTGGQALLTMDIANDISGYPRANIWGSEGIQTALILRIHTHVWTSATNVNSITLSSSVASSLDIGSTFSVYGMG